MSTTPILNGQVLGEAERASRALLDRLLARTGTEFHQWVVLNMTALNGNTIERDRLVDRMTGGLKVDEAAVVTAIDELAAARLVDTGATGGPAVALTAEGVARHREIRAGIEDIGTRLYAELPADDLATAGRVLTTITARANAELAID